MANNRITSSRSSSSSSSSSSCSSSDESSSSSDDDDVKNSHQQQVEYRQSQEDPPTNNTKHERSSSRPSITSRISTAIVAASSSSQSTTTSTAAAAATATTTTRSSPSMATASRSMNNVRRRLKLKGINFNTDDDNISVTDSICSGVIRDAKFAGALLAMSAKKTKGKIEDSIDKIESKIDKLAKKRDSKLGDEMEAETRATGRISNGSSNAEVAGRRGGGGNYADEDGNSTTTTSSGVAREILVSGRGGEVAVPTWSSGLTNDTNSSLGGGSDEEYDEIIRDIVDDDTTNGGRDGGSSSNNNYNQVEDAEEVHRRREARKDRVRERLERYRSEHGRLRTTCVALESALAKTSEKLRDIDARAKTKIEALEVELHEIRESESLTRTNQDMCIKELGKKLVKQAHVIKRQRSAVEQYKMQLEAMAEEMAMQDERDSRREDDIRRLESSLKESKDKHYGMQDMLQGNIDEMVALKAEVERDAKNIMDLEFQMGQKEAMLNRVARDLAEKTERICELEQCLEDKTFDIESTKSELLESKGNAEVLRQQLESAVQEIEDMKCNFSGWAKSTDAPGTSPGSSNGGVSKSSPGSPRSWRRQSLKVNDADTINSLPLMEVDNEDGNDCNMKEAFASELHAKDATIQILDEACKEKDATIVNLRSDMVKMSSTYKQDSYLKRKEIAKLKQINAEYALKLRALEKAFQVVNATGGMAAVDTEDGTKYMSHSLHGNGNGVGEGRGMIGSASLHSNKSGTNNNREAMAAAMSARLGGLKLRRDTKVVENANFMDDDTGRSSHKGEDPEEC